MPYLVTFRHEGNFYAEIQPMRTLAKMIGFRDVDELDNIRVYRLLPDHTPQPLHWNCERNSLYLYDRYGNFIDSSEYDEH